MKSYLDITLIPSCDIGSYFLWEKVFQQIHLALVEHINANQHRAVIALSFPEYAQIATENEEKSFRFTLGHKLRMMAPDANHLEALNIGKWLNRLQDYVHITKPRVVPDNIQHYVQFRRFQMKGSKERLARRLAKRQKIDYQQALQELKNYRQPLSELPYIWVKSLSCDKRYPLFIEKVEHPTCEGNLELGGYGLARSGFLPQF